MKRKQLGVYSKAPIDKLKDSVVGKLFGIIAGTITFGIVWIIVEKGVDMLNFIGDNTGESNMFSHADPAVTAAKAIVAGLAALFVLTRKTSA